ncbi:MAG: hypothetical protein CME71_08510 [Halobacteriovorax sp.]|nr:hypothetical protein [Halobacteriovorax sp.]
MKLITLFALLFSTSLWAKSISLEFSTHNRKAVKVQLPKKFDQRSNWPLIISLHGYGGSSLLQNYYVRLNSFQNDFGYVYATPEGLKDSKGKGYWNAGEFCCDFDQSDVNDIEFIKVLIDRIKSSENIGRINPKKVYLIGYSNGAFLASKIACSNSIDIAGIVTISGTSDLRDSNGELLDEAELNCEHQRAIPVLHVHGDEDTTITYNGFDNGRTAHVGARAQLRRWGLHNGCDDELTPVASPFNATNFVKGKETQHFEMKNCLAPVEHFKVHGGVHFGIYKKSFTKRILKFLLD